MFDFRQMLFDEDGDLDAEAASSYAEELCAQFAESPEGVALAERGGEPGHYLGFFLDYALRYTGRSPAEMEASDVRETLDVMAEKITSKPEDLEMAIPELEAFCDFAGRAFGFEKAAGWKRQIRRHGPAFRQAIRDPRRWGMAKSLMMRGLARGYDLSTAEGVDRWLVTAQAEQLGMAPAEAGEGSREWLSLWDRLRRRLGLGAPKGAPGVRQQDVTPLFIGDLTGGEPDLFAPGSGASSKRQRAKEKARRKQAQASRRRNRR